MNSSNRRISHEIETSLTWLAKAGIDNLFTTQALEELRKNRLKPPSRIGKTTIQRRKMLENQIPVGIYVKINELIELVDRSVRKNDINSLHFSPLSINFKEFSCCKPMKFNRGNVITGRDREIEDILLTLCKKDKRGVILVGDPGTGKTAIVKAISSRLLERTVPRQLIGCQMFNLDVPYIFSKYKEDPFGTIIKVLERASEYDKSILFIDEVHQLLTQKMNDIMKPYLTEKIRFIGSTTVNEFHSILSDDSALERRFTVVPILEPSIEQTVEMVTNTKGIFEDHHKCNIPKEICRYVVENGSRFRGHRKNPDKSLDLLDIACSIMYEKEIELQREKPTESTDFFDQIEINIRDIKSAKLVAKNRTLSEYYVNQAISAITGIPYNEIKNSLDYKEVVKNIKSVIVNQDEAIRKTANVVNIFKSVGHDRVRPISVLLMIGPAGVGKKTVGKLLAKNLFGKEDCFIDYDMSAFGESFRISELKGSPPGYIGYGKSGGLIKKIRNMPQSVIYFRGINKAHQTIQDYILNSCRNGKLIDSAEREASLNNAIVILSVTLSEQELKNIKKENSGMGFAKNTKSKDSTIDVEKLLGPNLANSVDEVIQFNELSDDDLKCIFDNNKEDVLSTYKVNIDPKELEQQVLSNSKNGHDVISRLTSEVPKLVFKKLSNEEMENEKKGISKKNRKDD